MADIAKRDQNYVAAIQGVSSIDGRTPTDIWVNPTTHGLIIDAASTYSALDARYLKLDASNDPITGNLQLNDGIQVVGSTDRIQSIVRANTTQTTSWQEWQNSTGTRYAWIDAAGKFQSDLGTGLQGYFMIGGAGNSTATGFLNIGIGLNVLAALTDGTYNVGISPGALQNVTSGANNVAIGYLAANSLTSGQRNFALGFQALRNATISFDVVAIGYQAANSHTGSGQLMAIGFQALGGTTGGVRSVAVGYQAGYQNSGQYSVYIGSEAGKGLVDNDECVFIGANAGVGETGNNKLHISNRLSYLSPLIYGEFDTKFVRFNGGYSVVPKTVSTAAYTITPADQIIHVLYTTTGAVTLTLDSDCVAKYSKIKIKDAGGNSSVHNITIQTEGVETIDGSATYTINSDYGAIELYTDGTNWFVN